MSDMEISHQLSEQSKNILPADPPLMQMLTGMSSTERSQPVVW